MYHVPSDMYKVQYLVQRMSLVTISHYISLALHVKNTSYFLPLPLFFPRNSKKMMNKILGYPGHKNNLEKLANR